MLLRVNAHWETRAFTSLSRVLDFVAGFIWQTGKCRDLLL
jgi:hypothetical protein